jgi:hypothetical protein
MNDHALMVIRDRLGEVRDSLGEVRPSIPASEIIARAKKRRTRRWLATAGAACAAVGLTLGLVLPSGSQLRPVHVHLTAWSVDTNSDGTVTVTVHELTHPALLVRVLGEAGVPAIVAIHGQCLNAQNQNALARSGALRSGHAGVVIHPAAIPSGTKILIGLILANQVRTWTPGAGWVRGHGDRVVGFGWGLVNNGKPLHCISTHHDAKYYSISRDPT